MSYGGGSYPFPNFLSQAHAHPGRCGKSLQPFLGFSFSGYEIRWEDLSPGHSREIVPANPDQRKRCAWLMRGSRLALFPHCFWTCGLRSNLLLLPSPESEGHRGWGCTYPESLESRKPVGPWGSFSGGGPGTLPLLILAH